MYQTVFTTCGQARRKITVYESMYKPVDKPDVSQTALLGSLDNRHCCQDSWQARWYTLDGYIYHSANMWYVNQPVQTIMFLKVFST